MAYAAGYKRPRQDQEFIPYGDYGRYAPPPIEYNPPTLAGPPPPLQPLQPLQSIQPLQPLQPQAPPPEPLRLGSAPDGMMPVVKLRGLPFSCDVDSVNMFLEVETVDVVLVKRQGRFSGEAFVVLPGMMQVEFALNKHKAYMGKRYVEVQQSCREDYYRAVTAFVEDYCLNHGPPPSRSQDYRTQSDHPDMRQPFYGQYGGAQMPPLSRSGMPLERGMGAMRPSSRDRRYEEKERIGPGPLPATGILRLRGLPFGVTSEEIADWFNDEGFLQEPIPLSSVHPVLAYDGRQTGSAFVEFSGPADAENAMAKDKAMMGSRYVELFHSCKDEMLIATSRR